MIKKKKTTAKKAKTSKSQSSLKKKKVAISSESTANHFGYTVVAKESKPTFSKNMINKMIASSKS